MPATKASQMRCGVLAVGGPFGCHVAAIKEQARGPVLGEVARTEIGGQQAEAALAPKVDLPQPVARGVEALQEEQVREVAARRWGMPQRSTVISAGAEQPGTISSSTCILVPNFRGRTDFRPPGSFATPGIGATDKPGRPVNPDTERQSPERALVDPAGAVGSARASAARSPGAGRSRPGRAPAHGR